MDLSKCLSLVLVLYTAVSGSLNTVAAESLRPVCCTEQDISVLEQQTARSWPNGIIPYQFSQQLSGNMKKRLLSAMSDWEVDSCVIFTPHSTEEDYVSFEMGERCCSKTGYTGHGKQDVLLGSPCTESNSESVLSDVIQLLVGEQNALAAGNRISSTVQKRQTGLEQSSSRFNNCHDSCGGHIMLDPLTNQIEHQLATPQYPQPYKTHLDCVWKLVAPNGYALRLKFHDINIENRCNHDYVRVQYMEQDGQLLRTRKLCGTPDIGELNKPSGHDYNTSAAVIHFHSDSSYGGRGVLLGYSLKERKANITDPCSVNNGGCVHICTSDAFGDHVCSCRPGYRQTRRGRCLDINECKTNNGGCDQKCTDTEGSFYCDCKIGYRLGYDQLSCIPCDTHFNKSSVTLYSPGYPTSYNHNQNCRWSIQRWPDHHLEVTVNNLEIPFSKKCRQDFLKLEPSNFPHQGRLCGHYSYIKYYVERNVNIRFRSRRMSEHHHSGFMLTFEQVRSSELDHSTLMNVTINSQHVQFRKRVWTL